MVPSLPSRLRFPQPPFASLHPIGCVSFLLDFDVLQPKSFYGFPSNVCRRVRVYVNLLARPSQQHYKWKIRKKKITEKKERIMPAVRYTNSAGRYDKEPIIKCKYWINPFIDSVRSYSTPIAPPPCTSLRLFSVQLHSASPLSSLTCACVCVCAWMSGTQMPRLIIYHMKQKRGRLLRDVSNDDFAVYNNHDGASHKFVSMSYRSTMSMHTAKPTERHCRRCILHTVGGLGWPMSTAMLQI